LFSHLEEIEELGKYLFKIISKDLDIISNQWHKYKEEMNKLIQSTNFEELNCNVIIKNQQINRTPPSSEGPKKKKKKQKFVSKIRNNLGLYKLYPQVKYILKIMRKYKIDILHCNDRLSSNIAGIIAAKLLGIKVIVHQRQFESNLPIIIKWIGNNVDKYFAVSNSISEDLTKNIGPNKAVPEILFNWISSENKNEIVKNRLGKNILWFGRIVPWKGVHLLIDIVELLRRDRVKFDKVILYGDADATTQDYFYSIKETISHKKLGEYFEFRGYTEFKDINISEFFSFVHTSIKPEPFGRTIIESMINEIPVFATKLGGVTDIIRDGYDGYLYDTNNLPEVIEKFKLLENVDTCNSIVKNAKNTVREKFSGINQIPRLIGSIVKDYYMFQLVLVFD
jgi:glycosyltransferase involved in cell wall biosynthesis